MSEPRSLGDFLRRGAPEGTAITDEFVRAVAECLEADPGMFEKPYWKLSGKGKRAWKRNQKTIMDVLGWPSEEWKAQHMRELWRTEPEFRKL